MIYLYLIVRLVLNYQHKISTTIWRKHRHQARRCSSARWKEQWFQEKNKFKKHAQTNNNYVDDLLRGVWFKTRKEGPKLYARTIERLGSWCEDMSNHWKIHDIPELADNHTVHEKRPPNNWNYEDQVHTQEQHVQSICHNNLCNL